MADAVRFNREQSAAIRHLDGPMMVLAGPGSGKTTVLVHRILHLVETKHVPPEQLLVLTFTRAAAREMELRYQSSLAEARNTGAKTSSTGTKRESGGSGAVTFGTFHSVFFRFLCEAKGLTARNIAGEGQCFALLRQVLCRQFAAQRFTTDMTELLLAAIGSCKNTGKLNPADCPVERTLFLKIVEAYGSAMEQAGLLDFDDMLLCCLKLLREEPERLTRLRRRFSYIMVDEFQDINQTQYEIVRLLSAPRNNLFIVGDDDQSIYGFRGARPQLMLNVPVQFPNCKTVLLGTNYRSAQPIVAHSLALIGHNRQRFTKALRAAAGPDANAQVQVYGVQSEQEETEQFLRKLLEARARGVPVSRMAVLCRTRKLAARLPEALRRTDIPFLGFGEKPVDACSALRLMTFHGSKGLEFDEVWIIGANEGDTPSELAGDAAAVEEERRMFYVAMTRAKRRLHIFVTLDSYNQKKKASRFVAEAGLRIPELPV